MQLDFDFGVLLHKLMELFGLQGEHVTVGQCLSCEDGGKKLPIVADVLCSMPTYLHRKVITHFGISVLSVAAAGQCLGNLVLQVLFRQYAGMLTAKCIT